jgi:hypothetical protein
VDKGHTYGALTDGVLEKSKNLPSPEVLCWFSAKFQELGVGSYFILKEICIKPQN